jgi:hypothetical protein
MNIYTQKWKAITTVALTISSATLVISLQPFFLGWMNFDTAIWVCCPIAFIVLVFLIIHFMQNWRLLLALFKTKKSYRVSRLAVTISMVIVGIMDISSGWVSAISGTSHYILLPMWVWSWAFTILIAIHIYQRREVFLSQWKKLGKGK